jgi:hypothetical protein
MAAQSATQATTLKHQAQALHHDLKQVMRRFGRQCRGQGKVFVGLVRQTETQLLEPGMPIASLAQAAKPCVQSPTQRCEPTRERLATHLNAALEAHRTIRQQSRRLTQGKRLTHGQIVHAYDGTIAPILTGKRNCPAQFGRQPGIISEPTAGFIFAARVPEGNPSDASSVLPLADNVQHALQRVTAPLKLAIHSVAGDLGVNDPRVRQALHDRGMLTVGIPKWSSPSIPSPRLRRSRPCLMRRA